MTQDDVIAACTALQAQGRAVTLLSCRSFCLAPRRVMMPA
jgi:hypothetical protein